MNDAPHSHHHGHARGGISRGEAPGAPLLELRGISFAYPGRPQVLDKLDYILNPGDRVGLVGANGAGKSTMFLVAMGLLKPRAGEVWAFGKKRVEEKDFLEVRARLGLCFQDPDDQLFSPTVLQDIAFGPLNLGLGKEQALARARETLEEMGLEGFEDRITHQLSGGEKRLVSLATVWAMRPDALLLDEPTAGLDQKTEARLKELLAGSHLSWTIISHDRPFLDETCAKVLEMDAGRIIQP